MILSGTGDSMLISGFNESPIDKIISVKGPQGDRGMPGTVLAWVNVLDHGADPTGVADSTAAFISAIAALPPTGGWIYAPSGTYKISSTLAFLEFQRLKGDGESSTVINYYGTGPCISGYGPTVGGPANVAFEGFTIDGTNASAGAAGIQIGSAANSFANDICIQNFNKTGSIGFNFKNPTAGGVLPYCDRGHFTNINLFLNTTAVVFDTGTFDYAEFEFYIDANANQNGVTLQNGVVLVGCRMAVRGDFGGGTTNAGWVFGIDQTGSGGSVIINTEFDIAVEANPVTSNGGLSGIGHKTIVMGSASTNCNCTGTGVMAFQTGAIAFQGASIHAGSKLGVSGYVHDPVLGFMALGDALTVQGGSQWSVKGSATTALVNGQTISPQVADVQEYLLVSGSQSVGAVTSGAAGLRARKLEILWHQPASGAAGTLTLPANVHCTGTLSTANGAVDKMVLTYYPSGDAWYGEIVGSTAATATKLATARNINGVAFDGTANITVTDSTKAPRLAPTAVKTSAYTAAVNDLVLSNGANTITLPATPADGSQVAVVKMDAKAAGFVTVAAGGSDAFNVSGGLTTINLQEQYQVDTLQYNATLAAWRVLSTAFNLGALDGRYLNQNTTGNAATATKLAAPKNINGVAFDGSADITVADSTKEPVITSGTSSQYWRGDKTMQTLNQDVVPDGTTNKAYTATEKTKLAGIASGATANSSDATLESRANHTGTQVAATISDFNTAADARVAAGNAGTATKLATARAIDSILFDGSADILLEQWIAQASAYTLTSQTAAQQLFNVTTNGAVTLGVGTYFFECIFSLTSMSATSGNFGFALGGTATFTQAWEAAAAKTFVGAAGASTSSFNTAANTGIATANTNTAGNALIRGVLHVTVTGTIIPQVSLGIAAAAIVGAGSHFRIKQASTSGTAASAGSWS